MNCALEVFALCGNGPNHSNLKAEAPESEKCLYLFTEILFLQEMKRDENTDELGS